MSSTLSCDVENLGLNPGRVGKFSLCTLDVRGSLSHEDNFICLEEVLDRSLIFLFNYRNQYFIN